MKKNYFYFKKLFPVLFSALFFYCAQMNGQTIVQTYTYTGALQTFVIPACVTTVTIEARGAGGGTLTGNGLFPGGLGANMKGVFAVNTGNVLNIIVGGKGNPEPSSSGGGGASGVGITTTPLIVAGGGAGVDFQDPAYSGRHAVITTAGVAGNATGGAGGTAGSDGGDVIYMGSGTHTSRGGRGWNTNNAGSFGQNGISVTSLTTSGTWGIGGGGGSVGYGVCNCGGGGGGYSGGGSGQINTSGGGGGSFNSGTSQVNVGGVNSGDGLVIISYVFNGTGISATASSQSICAGATVTLSASGVQSYTWSPGGSNATSILVAPSVSTNYTVQGTNSIGCISTSIIPIAVNATVPALSVASTATAVCLNKPVTLTASGAYTYTWTNSIINATPFNPSPVGTNVYTVSGSNACGTSSLTTSIVVNSLPNITASINNATVCSGGSVILNGGGASGNYTWTSGAPNNVAFVPSSTTGYTVTGGAVNGCTASAVTGVTVLVTPVIPPVATSTNICVGQTTTLSALGATGYTWIPGTSLNSASIAVSPTSTETYTLFRSNGTCSSTAILQVVMNPLPTIVASAQPSVICVGDPVVLNVFGAIAYNWMPGGFPQSNIALYPNNTTTYTVTGTNGNCSQTAMVTVSVNPSPNLTISTPTLFVCEGNSVTLTGGGVPTFTWYPGGSTNTTLLVTPPVTSQYTLTGTNAFNCTKSVTQLIVVNPVPVTTMTTSVPFSCAGANVNVGISGSSSGATYTWNTGATGPQITVNPTITTNYSVGGTFNGTGCNSSSNITLAVYISTFVVSSPTAVCLGSSATLTASGDATSYSWSNGGTQATTIVSPVTATNYSVIGTTGSCTTQVVVPMVVNPVPNVFATVMPATICRFEVGTATAGNANTYTWIAPNNGTPATPSFTYNNLNVSTTFTVTGTNLNGCSKTTTVTQFVATCVGIESLRANGVMDINLYPNPNNGNFMIESDVNVNVNIVNTLGQIVSSLELSKDNQNEITVSKLPNGIYFITGETNGLKIHKKFVIHK